MATIKTPSQSNDGGSTAWPNLPPRPTAPQTQTTANNTSSSGGALPVTQDGNRTNYGAASVPTGSYGTAQYDGPNYTPATGRSKYDSIGPEAGYIDNPVAEQIAAGNMKENPSGPGATDIVGAARNLYNNMFGGGNSSGGDNGNTDQPTYNPNGNNQSGDTNGSSGSGGSGGGSGSSGGSTGYSDATLLAQALAAAGITAEPYQLPEVSGPNAQPVDHVDTTQLKEMLQQILDSQKQQGQQQIDYSVEQGVNELNRAMEDAAIQYQTQRNQATADELRALDNQALYAEARGDRGGIGQAQYASIQAAAAQNRRAVNDAQVKLGTDTARQIADLRAQGEFQKANQLLSLTQSYLAQLMSLEQWALQTNLGVDEFNSQLQQWADEYNLNVQKFLSDLDLSAAQLTGVFADGTKTLAYQQQLNESLANSGAALLSAGVLPSRQQLEAMGMTEVQAKAYLNKTGA